MTVYYARANGFTLLENPYILYMLVSSKQKTLDYSFHIISRWDLDLLVYTTRSHFFQKPCNLLNLL